MYSFMKHHLFILTFIGLGLLPVADVKAQYDTLIWI